MLLAVGFSVMSVALQRSICMLSLLGVVELLVVSEMQITLQWTCSQPWQKKPYQRIEPLVHESLKLCLSKCSGQGKAHHSTAGDPQVLAIASGTDITCK